MSIAPIAISVLGGDKVHWLAIIALNLTAFVLIALACHGEAYRLRPEPARLTEFYLWTSFGGVIGGVFAGLDRAQRVQQHLRVSDPDRRGAAGAARHLDGTACANSSKQSAPPLALAALVVALRFALDVRLPLRRRIADAGRAGAARRLSCCSRRASRRASWGLSCWPSPSPARGRPASTPVETVRSFFGVHQVVETSDRTHRLLFHGTTIHGAERVRDASGRPVHWHARCR